MSRRIHRLLLKGWQAVDIYRFCVVDLDALHHYSRVSIKLSQYTCMADNPLKELENKIDELVSLCKELNHENGALKAEIAGWRDERKDLIDKNELARSKVEAMIDRLRTME
jgi:cell division protein ZapB